MAEAMSRSEKWRISRRGRKLIETLRPVLATANRAAADRIGLKGDYVFPVNTSRAQLRRIKEAAWAFASALDDFTEDELEGAARVLAAPTSDAVKCENCRKPTTNPMRTADDIELCQECWRALGGAGV